MKFLHLSDLHIGKNVNGFSMIGEQCNVFSQIIGYINAEKPDVVVIAGDIYDRSVPSVEAVRLFDNFLNDLSNSAVTVIIISGNHDSPERLNYARRFLLDKNIYLCGVFENKISKVQMCDEYGEINFYLLPFIRPGNMRLLFKDLNIESYTEAFLAAIKTTDIDYEKRNVLVAHQFFIKPGVDFVCSESEFNPVGGLDAIDCELISNFDYVALGHLHGSQKVGYEHIRYSGSPLKYSFSECNQQKSIILVTLNEKSFPITIKKLPLVPICDIREIKGKLEDLLKVSDSENSHDYVRVILTDSEEIFDPMGKIRSVYPNVMALAFENLPDIMISNINDFKDELSSPYEMFKDFFLEITGSVMSEEQDNIVREIFEDSIGEYDETC